MLIKMLGVAFAGVFVGAAVFEMKTHRQAKKKERRKPKAAPIKTDASSDTEESATEESATE